MVDSLLHDGLHCAIMNYHMGVTAENVAQDYHISREAQDALAFESHRKSLAAQEEGLFDAEIVPVEIVKKGKSTFVSKDEGPKPETTPEILAKLKPVFREDGTVTAGNASSMNDGAAAVVLVSEKKLKELSLTPLAEIKSIVSYGVEPRVMGIGPMFAIPKVLKDAGLKKEDVGVFEVNEAFAAQCVAVIRDLDLPKELVNPVGSGISLGHPVGCTGIRLIVTMLHHMKRNQIRYGLASLCVGGGPAMATVLEYCTNT
ncbi:Acetyl-CoA acetyltransferase [bioreactor metagenome]|uniref:Acetyl-CoA acetyltransferase n=1 Tax=bioreactor metagenome TaxID=1076179 RepID=A0A645E535_9ZZZZ